ncbi:uncharacterized protein BT62DRAFT_928634 [Guyanagaster necrorhizus]|uniref:Uncharacterized protein n=1 Tax=Guyanagaster necrorhizus TaxID=856835 RepID=A0A9P7W0E2_9AGAR|nr:uncharacterized protein BT62DRAFT_928634 [Guyanagaster necrorhizus MCA 3950]KAG7449877.1 hypothetical protein BT62DRAFT_928634 [Guyanagaster necrorhizus MCA 3950]
MLITGDFLYGPCSSVWGTVPPDATQVYTIHCSPALAPVLIKWKEILSKLHKSNTGIPRIQAAASTSSCSTLFWEGFEDIGPTQDLLAHCRHQTVKLVFGDMALLNLTRHRRCRNHTPEFEKLVEDAVFPQNGDLSLSILIWIFSGSWGRVFLC